MFSYMAVTSIGALAVTLNSWWQGEELDYGITHSESKVFMDPHQLSNDGTIALGGTSFSNDHKYMVYSVSIAGSD